MAHDVWKDDITFLGCRTCWSNKVLKFAFVADITKFDPDRAYFSQHVLDAICTFSFNNNNKRPLTPKSMPPAGDEHAKLSNIHANAKNMPQITQVDFF